MRIITDRTQRVWRRAVLLFALGVLIIPTGMVGAQSGNIGGRVANPDPDNPRSKSIFIYTLDRGETKKDQLLVVNRSDEEQTITLGSVDGVVTNTGDYTCRQEVEPLEDSGSWVQLSKQEVVLPAGGEELVDFTVTVPTQADVGEHNSCLTMQAVEEDTEDEATSGVRLRTRQAIRMVVTIPGELRRDISIENFAVTHGLSTRPFYLFGESTFEKNADLKEMLTFEQKSALQQYALTVANKGNVSADVYMRVQVASKLTIPWMNSQIADIGGEYPVVPDESLTREFTTELQPLFGGWYKATPSLRYDKRLGVFGTSGTGAEYETIVGSSVDMFFWPTILGWIIIAIILIFILIIIWHTTGSVKRRRTLKNSASKYKVKKADTIQSLAKKSKVSWEDLASLNNIPEPYSLEVGQTILLPNYKKKRTTRRKSSAPKKKK